MRSNRDQSNVMLCIRFVGPPGSPKRLLSTATDRFCRSGLGGVTCFNGSSLCSPFDLIMIFTFFNGVEIGYWV